MRRAVWANTALHDFDQAIFYIAQDDPRAALLVADRIAVALNGLAVMPTGRAGRVSGTYEKSVTRAPYILAYAVTDEAVTILRVIHSSRDWRNESWPK